jgi:hypothetical protein
LQEFWTEERELPADEATEIERDSGLLEINAVARDDGQSWTSAGERSGCL